MKEIIFEQEEFYSNNLSNYDTVLRDTNNAIITEDDGYYNCMSYALGIFNDWLLVRDICYEYEGDRFNEEDMADLQDNAYNCAMELENLWGCRRLKTEYDALQEGERVIAFRIGFDDFHFARKNSDGNWTHKPGCGTIRAMSREELYGDEWCSYRCCPYISDVYFFALRDEAIREVYNNNYEIDCDDEEDWCI